MPSPTDRIIAKTDAYLRVPSVVGYEAPLLSALDADFRALGLTTTRHEGLLEVAGARPMSAIVCAHADRHGLISLGGGEYVYAAQYIKEIKYGQNNRASQKEIENITQRFEGELVYAYDTQSGAHKGEGTIMRCDACVKRHGDAVFLIDGMDDPGQGVPIAYARRAREENGLLRGQLDNAISLGTLYALFESGFDGTALISTEEEIGKSWMHLMRWLDLAHVHTRDLIVIDTSPFSDHAPIEEGHIILRNRDMSAPFNEDMTALLKARTQDLGLSWQAKDEILKAQGKKTEQLGSTELGKLILNSRGRFGGVTVQIPTLMYHTSNESTSRLAIGHYFALLHNILVEDPLPFMNTIETHNNKNT